MVLVPFLARFPIRVYFHDRRTKVSKISFEFRCCPDKVVSKIGVRRSKFFWICVVVCKHVLIGLIFFPTVVWFSCNSPELIDVFGIQCIAWNRFFPCDEAAKMKYKHVYHLWNAPTSLLVCFGGSVLWRWIRFLRRGRDGVCCAVQKPTSSITITSSFWLRFRFGDLIISWACSYLFW